MNKSKNNKINAKGVTLVALVVTIIIILILSGIVLSLTVGNNGIFTRSKIASDEHIKQEAKEAMNLKITGIQIQSYTETEQLATLQYLADKLCEDEEMEYVIKKEPKQASLEKIDVKDVSAIFTKIKKYPYEFEIDSNLSLASIDGVKIANNESVIPDGYIKPSGTKEIIENGEYDVSSYEKANVNVPNVIPDNYMEKPTQENVKITQKAKNIDVTNYKSIDTTGLYTASEVNGRGITWNDGTISVTDSTTLSLNIGFVPSFICLTNTANGKCIIYKSSISTTQQYAVGEARPLGGGNASQSSILSVNSIVKFKSAANSSWYWIAVK